MVGVYVPIDLHRAVKHKAKADKVKGIFSKLVIPALIEYAQEKPQEVTA